MDNAPRHIWSADLRADCFLCRDFALAARPKEAILRIFVDTGYALFLNGRLVAALDEWNNARDYAVGAFLQDGANRIAVHAMNHGGHRGCAVELLCDGASVLRSDATWAAAAHEHWGWRLPGFDDTAWPRATTLPLDHAGATAWHTPPGDDPARIVPNLHGTVFFVGEIPKGVASPFYDRPPPPAAPDPAAAELLGKDYLESYHAKPESYPAPRVFSVTGPGIADGDGKVFTLSAPDRYRGPSLVFDFGGEVVGYFRLRLASSGPIRFRLNYGETIDEIRRPPAPEHLLARVLTEEYSLPPGEHEFESRMRAGCRFTRAEFFHTPHPTTVRDAHLRASLYPVAYRGYFASSDPWLDRLWQDSRRTLHLCMQEYYIDAPKRDRFLWLGDARLQAMFNHYAFGDQALFRFCWRETARLQRPDGSLPAAAERGGSVLWDYVAHWILALREYYFYTGDVDFALSMRETVYAAMEFLSAKADADGLIDIPVNPHPLWMVVLDGPAGKSPFLNRLFRESLDAAHDLAELAGDTARAARYRGQGEKTARALRAIPDPCPARITRALAGYFSVDRLYENKDPEAADALFRKLWAPATGWGMNTLPEQLDMGRPVAVDTPHAAPSAGYGSWCHGWTAAPLALLPGRMAGIRPVEPGFARFRVTPRPGKLKHLRTAVPTPHGDIALILKREDDRSTMALVVPPGTEAEVETPSGGTRIFPPGSHSIPG